MPCAVVRDVASPRPGDVLEHPAHRAALDVAESLWQHLEVADLRRLGRIVIVPFMPFVAVVVTRMIVGIVVVPFMPGITVIVARVIVLRVELRAHLHRVGGVAVASLDRGQEVEEDRAEEDPRRERERRVVSAVGPPPDERNEPAEQADEQDRGE